MTMHMMRRNLLMLLLLFSPGLCPTLVARDAEPETLALINRGVELFDYGRWIDARHEFLRAQESLDPADRYERQKVEYYLAACAVERGERDAEATLLRFVAQWPGSVFSNDVLFSLASYYCTQGDMAAAARTFAEVDYDSLTPQRKAQYDIRMGYAAFGAGRYDEAYDYFERVDPRSEYADHALYYRSYIEYSRGDYARAKAGFDRLATSAAYADLVPYYLLQLEFMEGNYRYVVQRGDALIAQAAPQHRVELERVMAESWYHLGDFNRTLEYLSAYRRHDGAFGRNEEYLMGYSLYRTARYSDAEAYLRRACGADDALTQNASYHLADCYVRRGAKREAMQSFAMAANDAFDTTIAEDALFNYGKLQYELGGGVFNEAINVLTRYIERYPASERVPQARELLIAAYYNSRNYDAAYDAIKAVASPDSEVRAALQKIAYFRALEAWTAGDRNAAKRLLAESAAVGVSPKYNALVLFWQGEIAYAEGDYATAAERYSSYMRRAPRNASEYALASYNLGYTRFEQQRMKEAGDAFTRFLSLHRTADAYRADAWNRLGDTQYSSRQFSQAAESYAKAMSSSGPERYYAQYQRAVTLGILGRSDAKIEALQRIITAGEGDYTDDASYELGRTYIARGNYAEGARALERYVEEYPASPMRTQALSELGLAWLNLGNQEKSLRYYDAVVAAAPQSAEAKGAMEGIRDIYVSRGDVDSYFAYAEKVGLESDVTLVARDSLTFAAAQQLYLAQQNEPAARALSSYTERFPKGYYLTDALYYLSDCYLRLGRRDEAITTLGALADRTPNPYLATALERLAEMTYADKRYAEAASAYRRLYDAASERAKREAAMTGYVRATLAQNDPALIAPMATDVAAAADAGTVAVRESQFAWAEQLRLRGETKEALKIYRKLAGEVKSAEGAAAAYYVLEDALANGDPGEAEKLVFAYIDRQTPHAYWLAKAYLLLGDAYARKGDAFQARATWQSVADGYSPADDGIVDEAKRRIATLN